MSVKDIRSNLKQSVALAAAISSNTTTSGAIIDNANFDLGVMLSLDVTAYTDGNYEFQLFESDDDGMAGAAQVTGDKLIGSIADATAAVAEGDQLATLGAISTLRYLQVRIVSTSVTTGATLRVIATQMAEVMPVEGV